MEFYFDEMFYHNRQIICAGWAVPAKAGAPLLITVKDQKGKEIAFTCRAVSRPDVGEAKYKDRKLDQYGFSLRISCQDLPYRLTVFFSDGGEDLAEAVLFPMKMAAQHLKTMSLPAKLKRYWKAEDRENFFRTDRFFDYEAKDREYAVWKELHTPNRKALNAQRTERLYETPLISLLMPVYRPKCRHLAEMIASVRKQTYSRWELCIACSDPETSENGIYLKKQVREDQRIHVTFLEKNLGISGNTNEALKLASGEWIGFVDQDDLLREDALYEYAKAAHMNLADVIYCDEDKIDDETGIYFEPHFKSDFNPVLLTCSNYICHMLMVRASLAAEVGMLNPSMDGAQDHDFILRCMEKTERFCHISKILYSWRCHRDSTAYGSEAKSYAVLAGQKAVQAYYDRNGIQARVQILREQWYKTLFYSEEQPLVSILIPNKDHISDLTRCIDSILEKSTWTNFEILIAENNSTEPETFAAYEKLAERDSRIRLLTWEHEFNFAAICNFAAAQARGEYLLLLNNDTQVISPDFLESMAGYARILKTGAVGAKLYYPDDRVQHAGVLVGVSGAADHVFLNQRREETGYMGRAIISQNMSAVTAACLLIRRSVYEEVGGMEEQFTVAYNDVDLCLKLRHAGYRIVMDAFAELYHFESASRGYEETEDKKERFEKEKMLLRERWPRDLLSDPFYNRNLSLKHGYYQI